MNTNTIAARAYATRSITEVWNHMNYTYEAAEAAAALIQELDTTGWDEAAEEQLDTLRNEAAHCDREGLADLLDQAEADVTNAWNENN